MSSTAKDGTVWSSQAQFQTDADGAFTTTQAPNAGSYLIADPMGLTQTLTPGRPGAYFTTPDPWTMVESVAVGGKTVASTTITRLLPSAAALHKRDLRPSADGVYGEMFQPASTSTRPAPAVLVFGGSEGGLGNSAITAALLAAHGFPALAVAYFDEPDLPQNLEKIPLEYFQRAAQLLAAQPGVDPHRIVLYGDSRGSEAALLTAADYPTLVHAVIGAVPSAEAVVGLPDNSVAAWTRDGAPVPTGPPSDFDLQSPTSPAAIPVERSAARSC
ncbi:poly(3-hydroxybutyrate) depolymerase [Nakamurella sp. UYEF19]|uniref:acyl-CoA thioesterase/bile acid-CoA:amino acid N-acyltransferase family protein n=1 Tax=Nakamurella sp. UYEF19 TaxID=1756392 RepID=UPI00339670A1